MSTSLQQANMSGEEDSLHDTALPPPPIKSGLSVNVVNSNSPSNKVSDSSSLDTPPHPSTNKPISPREFLTDSDNETNTSCRMYLRSQSSSAPTSPVKRSRTGESFQVTALPEAGSYKKEKRSPSSMPQKMWDPARAKRMGLDDFIQLYCPKNKKEIAMTLLHRRNYKITGFLEALQEIPPNDGSEWTQEERDNFLSLLQQNKYNFHKVAKAMSKTVSNCLTVYYKIINVRKTRNRRNKVNSEPSSDKKELPKELSEVKIEQDTNQTSNMPMETRSNERKRRAESDVSTETEISSSDEKTLESKPSHDDKENKKIVPVRRSKRFKPSTDEEEDAATKNKSEELAKGSPGKEAATNDESQDSQQEDSESSEEEEEEDSPEKDQVRRSARLGGTSTSSSVSAITGLRKRAPKIEPRKLPTRKELPVRKAAAAQKAASEKIHLSDQTHLDTPNTTAQDEQWEKTLRSLIKFKEEHGHCLVPKIYPENQNLSYWVFRQRG